MIMMRIVVEKFILVASCYGLDDKIGLEFLMTMMNTFVMMMMVIFDMMMVILFLMIMMITFVMMMMVKFVMIVVILSCDDDKKDLYRR